MAVVCGDLRAGIADRLGDVGRLAVYRDPAIPPEAAMSVPAAQLYFSKRRVILDGMPLTWRPLACDA